MPAAVVNGINWNYYLVGNAPNQTAGIGDGTTNFGNATTYALSGAVTIPDTIGAANYPVTEIGEYSFISKSFTSVIIPNSVTNIKYAAFYNCAILTSVKIGNSVTTIGGYAFYTCPNLTSINIPDSVTTIISTSGDVFAGTSSNLVITMSHLKFGITVPSTNQTFHGNNSVDFQLPPQATMTITSATVASGSTTNNATIALTFTSSQSTTDFLVGDISVTNGTLSSPLGGSGAVYTATFTPTGQGACTINVAANKFTASGVNNNASNTFTWTFDSVRPSMTITSTTVTSGSTTNNATIALTFTSSEATTNFGAGGISLTNGSLFTSFTAISPTVYNAIFTPNGQGACTIGVAAGAYTDAVGNTNTAAPTFNWTFDSVSPSMTITSTTVNSGSTTNNAFIELTFTSTEATNNFVKESITLTNGSLFTSFTAISPTVYNAIFTPNGQGACTIGVAANKFTDSAGNNNIAATTFNWTFDSVPPTMTITSTTVTSGSTTNNAFIALTFTSSKATTNFLVGSISLTNGTLASSFTAISATVYNAIFTPTGQGACTIDVSGGAYTDAVGNSNTAATTFTWTFDNISPSMTITSTTDGVTIGSANNNATVELTFTSSEATTNFGEGGISLTNGTLTNFAGSGTVYTATFTPTGEGVCAVDVAAGAYTDAATNINNLATQFRWTFEINDYGNSTPTALSFVNNTLNVLNRIDSADVDTVVFDVTAGSLLYSLTVTHLHNANSMSYVLDISGGSTLSSGSFTQAGVDLLNGNALEQATNTSYNLTLTSSGSNVYSIVGKSLDTGYTIANMLSVGYIPNFAAFNDANKLEQTYISGFLDISGDIIHRSGNLTVNDGNLLVNAGDVSFNTGKLYVAGNVSMNSNMIVAGATKVTHIAASGNMDVSGASSLDGTLTIANTAAFNDNVSISNNNAFIVGSGVTTMGGIVSMNSQLTVAEDVFMNSTLNVLGATTLTNVSIDGDLLSSGKTIFSNDVSFNGTAVDICGNLYAHYPAGTIPLSAVIVGGSIFQSDVSLNSALNVAGTTTMSSIIASGAATVGGTLVVVGATTLSSLNTSSNAVVGGTLVVSGKTTGSGDISFNGSRIDICGNLYANYPANSIPLAAIVSDNSPIFNTDVSMNSRLNIVGATTLSSLVASGKTRFSGDVSMNGSRIDICGNLYANYQANSIPQSAIIGGVGSVFTTDVTMNTRLYVRDRITLGSATLQYKDVWQKVGADIDGEAPSNAAGFGYSVAISSDGSIVAIGTAHNDGTTTNSNDNRGHVRVYQKNISNDWAQLGSDIDGEALGDQSGYSVSLSADGSIVAIGAIQNDGTTTNVNDVRGSVRLYQIDLSDTALGWQKVGNDIDGEAANDSSGVSVSLSSNGLVVAIGAKFNDGTTTNASDNRGHVRVYERDASNNTIEPLGWKQVGGDIDGEPGNQGDQSGQAISLSSNGSIVAIGAFMNDGTVMHSDRGHVRVYQRNISNETIAPVGWSQLGNDIDGEATDDQSGYSVSLSSDGSIVAIGAIYNDGTTGNVNDKRGHVRIYRIDLSNAVLGWKQLGGDIDGEADIDNSGISVSLSGDGTIVAIGANVNDGTTTNPVDYRGHVRVYQRNLSTNIWTQWGPDIDGESAGVQSGYAVALSKDGLSVAIGAPENDGTTTNAGDNRGSVRIYKRDINVPVNGLYVDKSLVATDVSLGTLSIGSTLGITGETTLATLVISGNSSVGGTLAINGATTTTSFVSSGAATLGGTLAVTGATTFAADASLNSKLTVVDDVSMNSKFFVGGDVSLNSKLFVGGDVSLNSALSIVGATTLTNTTINSTLTVTGATTVPALNVLGNLTGTTLFYTGQSILNGDVSMNSKLIVGGNVTMNSKLAVTGATTISALTLTSNAIVAGTLGVTGKTIFGADVSMNSTALIAGDVSLNSNLTVATNTTIGGTLRVAGATTASSTLTVTGATTIGGTLGVTGKATFAGNATLNGNLDISGNLSVKGNTILALANIQSMQLWQQLGNDIDGETATNYSGGAVALSGDGSIIAIGAQGNGGATTNDLRGHVRVYQRNISNTTITPIGWTKLGDDIDGEASDDRSGYSVSLSSNGTIVAIGAIRNSVYRGHVRVYQRDVSNTTITPIGWKKLGDDIDGEAFYDESGWTVSLSSDGEIVAIGAISNVGTAGTGRGHVQVYKRDASNNTIAPIGWKKVGVEIDGESADDTSGYSVSLSSNGKVVAIGAINNDGTVADNNRGHVRVYTDISNVWIKVGGDIDGKNAGDNSGISVSLSSDGSVVAIGARFNDGTTINTADERGHVRIYKRDASNNTIAPIGWTQLGGDINGEAAGDQLGHSVSLSSDGLTVAIGAIYNDGTSGTSLDNRGHVRVYKYISNVWIQLGNDIDGEAAGDESGVSASLSDDGSILAVGARFNDGTSGTDRGHVRVYYLSPFSTYTNAPLVSTDLITTGNTTVSGALSVTSSTSISSTLSVSGATTMTSLTTSRNAAFGSTLQVTGATTLTTLQVTGATTLTSLAATGNAVIGGTLVVTGATTMSSLNVSGLIKKR
jgi:hypothetical protein